MEITSVAWYDKDYIGLWLGPDILKDQCPSDTIAYLESVSPHWCITLRHENWQAQISAGPGWRTTILMPSANDLSAHLSQTQKVDA